MSKLRIVNYDKEKPTVFVDLNETLITSLYWYECKKAKKLGLLFPSEGTRVQNIVHWLRPDAEHFLEELTARGYQLFLLTRGWRPYQQEVVEKLGISQYFLQVLGEKQYKPKRPDITGKTMPEPKYFVLFDDAALANDDKLRSIWKLKGLGLKLPTEYEHWTETHKALADRHFVLCDEWEIAGPTDLEIDPPPLIPFINEIDKKLQAQLLNTGETHDK